MRIEKVYGVGDIVTVKECSINNQVGGTEFLRREVQAEITDAWEDDECGRRFIGKLLRKEDIKASKEVGKSEFTPEDYKKYGEEMYQDILKKYKRYNPKRVYFSEYDIIEKGEK